MTKANININSIFKILIYIFLFHGSAVEVPWKGHGCAAEVSLKNGWIANIQQSKTHVLKCIKSPGHGRQSISQPMRIVARIPKKSGKIRQKSNFFCAAILHPLWAKVATQIWDRFFPLVFPKDSENLESLDIGLWEVEAKRSFNGVNKWSKKAVKDLFCCGNFLPFLRKNVQIWDHFFLLLFPKDS